MIDGLNGTEEFTEALITKYEDKYRTMYIYQSEVQRDKF